MKRAFLVAAAVLLAGSGSVQAQACGATDSITDELLQKWGETLTLYRVRDDGKALLQIYASERGTWTAIISTPDGVSCVVTAGNGWQHKQRRRQIEREAWPR